VIETVGANNTAFRGSLKDNLIFWLKIFWSWGQCYEAQFSAIFAKTCSSLSKKRQYFCQTFRRNYFKNHNIGPRGEFFKTRVGVNSRVGANSRLWHA
jgi:hypothetical protein